MRNRILKGEIIKNECDSDEVYKFLKLLYNPFFADRYFEPITKDEWVRVVKAAKKASTSLIYSKHIYAIYKCTLESKKITDILVSFYNTLIQKEYFVKR